jgi:beta-lactamase regulating signal transducer with metallopeptidase domain
MPSLSQSPMLQALGYAIAHSLWQMAMVWIVYVLLNSVFKFKSETKYRIAVAAQVVGFAWFIGTLQFYYTQCSEALRVAEAIYLQSGDQGSVVFASGKSNLLSFFIKAEQVLPYLSVAYLLLLAFLVIRWFRAYRYTQLVRLNGLHKIDVDWKLFVTKVAGQLGIKQKVRIYLSELVQSPVTIGFLKPVILIPIASVTHLSPQQLEAVILHELAHIKRHDYLLNIVLSVIDLGLFFNPFTRLITKSVSKERENSCDDWVLQYQYNPTMYAEALLRIAVLQKTPAMAMYAVKTRSELASRVQRMVNQKDGRFSYRHQLIALLLMTGILTSIAWYDPAAIKNQEIRPTAENKAVVLEPLAAKVDNPLFNPMFFLNEPLKEEVKKNVEAAARKQMHKLPKNTELAVRDLRLPDVMAPVAIEKMKDLEKNLASITKEMKKTWVATSPREMKPSRDQVFTAHNLFAGADAQLFHFDSARFSNAFAFNTNPGGNWVAFTEELKASQKAIEDAMKKGKISQIDGKKMQAEIAAAFKNLKEIKWPQVYSYAPGSIAVPGGQAFYKADDYNEAELQKDKLRTDEKKKLDQRERIINGSRIRKSLVDSIKQKLLARTVPVLVPPQAHGYMSLSEHTPYLTSDELKEITTYVNGAAKARTVWSGSLPRKKEGQEESSTYNYVYTEDGEECDKANRTERHRKVSTVPPPKTRPVNSCTKTVTTTKNGSCIQVLVTPPKPQTQPVIIEVE